MIHIEKLPNDLHRPLDVWEVMSTGLLTATPDESVSVVAARARREGVHHVIVVHGSGVLRGMLCACDMERAWPDSRVVDAMTTSTLFIGPGLSLADAAQTMERYGVGALPVLALDGRALGVVTRSDLRRRNGIELISVADSYLMDLFDALNIRVQFVGDWQVRTTGFPGATAGILAWPTTVQALVYAPGTFVLGNGLQLNLGVIRDSVLNATNDYTAAWMEECWLIAKLGHESRLVTINVCANGRTGANDLTACGV